MNLSWRAFVAPLMAVCLIGSPMALQAQTEPLEYPTIEKPVVSDEGMVVSQSAIASRVGADVLRRGGNAVDAAIATAFALAVTLPRAGNIGGDGFMLVYLAKEDRTTAIDYRSIAPAQARIEDYLLEDGSYEGAASRGIKSAGVPGTVAGLELAHRKYGSLPWKDLVAPAISLASEGVLLTRDAVSTIERSRERLSGEGSAAKVFFKPDGASHVHGERLRHPDLAWSLRQIQQGGADAFYRGPIARRIANGMAEGGGLITLADLASYRAIEREPLVGSYRGVKVVTMPPASGGGAAMLEMLNILEQFDMKAAGWGSARAYHLFAEALKLSYEDRFRFATDPAYADMPLEGMTSKAYAAERAKLIAPEHAAAPSETGPGDPWAYEGKDTTHFSVIDADGNAVSNTFTLGNNFGSGVMLEGTGFLFANLIGNFGVRQEAAERIDGKLRSANKLEGGRRPISSMSPTMLFRDDKLWAITGSPGGNTIAGTVTQMVINLVDFDLSVAEATHAPRIYPDYQTGEMDIEPGLSPDTVRLLKQWGHHPETGETIGSTQSIQRVGSEVHGAADPRRPGAGAVAAE